MTYEPEYYTVGELAKNYGVPISTLRFYDKQGIFVPEYRNPENGYRYYSSGQLLMLDVILFLRELGVPTNKIPEFIQNAKSRADLLAALREHNAEVKERIQSLLAISAKLDEVDWMFSSSPPPITGQVEEVQLQERVFWERKAVNLPADGADRHFKFRKHMLSRSTAYVTPPPMHSMGVIYDLDELKRSGVLSCSRQFIEFGDGGQASKGGERVVIPAGRYLMIRFSGAPGQRMEAFKTLQSYISDTGLKTARELIEASFGLGMPPLREDEELMEFQLRVLE